MLKTTDRYIIGQFLKPFLVVLLTFAGLFLFVDTAEKIRPLMNYIKDAPGNWVEVVYFLLGNVFCYLMMLMPLVLSLSVSICFISLNKTGQMRAFASFSLPYRRVFLAPFLLCGLIGVCYFLLSYELLPTLKRNTDLRFKEIKNKSELYKDIVVKEPISISNLASEFSKDLRSEADKKADFEIGRPAVLQIIEVRNLSSLTGEAKEMYLLRFDENNKVVRRIQLSDSKFAAGFIFGSKGKEEIYEDGNFIKSRSIDSSNHFATNFNRESILNEYYIAEDASQVSISTLFEKRKINKAKKEIVDRSMYPLLVLLLSMMALAISAIFDFTKLYLSFGLLIGLLLFYIMLSFLSTVILPNHLHWFSSVVAMGLGYLVMARAYRLVQ